MKLGKKQTAYGVVLGLAAAGFVVDRLFFTPTAAEAAAPHAAPASPALAAPQSPSASTVTPPIPAGWLAERLRGASADSDNQLRDVFAVPASWRPAPKAAAAEAAPKPKLFGDQFRTEHHLEAVVIDGRKSRAVVDGQMVSVGISIDGFQLVALGRQSARFIRGEEQVSLSLNSAQNPMPR
jgi:hypothetical protein